MATNEEESTGIQDASASNDASKDSPMTDAKVAPKRSDSLSTVASKDYADEDLPMMDAKVAPTKRDSPTVSSAASSSSAASKDNADEDPFRIHQRFVRTQRVHFARAVREIENGKKESCWFWFVLPTPPYFVDGVERGSSTNRQFALRSEEEVKAYLSTSVDGVNLRENYVAMLRAIEKKLRNGSSLRRLFGPLDDVKAVSSFRLFEKIAMSMKDKELYLLCRNVLKLHEKSAGWKKVKKWIVPFRTPARR